MPEHEVDAAKPAASVGPAAFREAVEAFTRADAPHAVPSLSRGLLAQRRLQVGALDDPLEAEANRAADQVMRMPDRPFVQRLCEECEEEEEVVSRKPIASPGIFAQPKLEVGAADDPLELEADRVADHVMRMPDRPFVQRLCEECEEEEQMGSRKPVYAVMRKACSTCEPASEDRPAVSFLQRKASTDAGAASGAVAEHIATTRGAGAAMPAETRASMEDRFGADFSGVSIHAGSSAAKVSSELAAQAFTVGKDIYFNDGKYAPDTSEGQHLLAHELVHVIQQSPDVRRKESPSAIRRRATK